jgi:hypothetical protein
VCGFAAAQPVIGLAVAAGAASYSAMIFQSLHTRFLGASGPSNVATRQERIMMLATTKVEDFDRFLKIFSTKGLVKRKQYGSKGATVFRDPNETDRVWVIFDWDAEGFKKYVSDPEVPAILEEAGHKGKPQAAAMGGQYQA